VIVIFDLDDTLYPEATYVHSGFRAVARAATDRFGGEAEWALSLMLDSLAKRGRGRQFNDLADALEVSGQAVVRWMVKTYRHHVPQIALPAVSDAVLRACSDDPLYLVTDGHKIAQARKVSGLGLWDRFRRCYLTNRYGVHHQKPSPYVFELILKREGARGHDAVYIGDNPRKDFRGIRPLGFRTVRVRQGSHRDVEVSPEHDAEVSIDTLDELLPILARWGWGSGRKG